MYQDNILSLKCVTGTAPLQFFGQTTVENDLPELSKFFLPLRGLIEEEFNFGILFVHCLMLRNK